MLNEEILRDCEEFFELIEGEDTEPKLSRAIEALRTFLENDVDGWTQHTDDVLARSVQCRLMEIWGLIPRDYKRADPDLKEYYDNIVTQLEEVSGYETDDEDEGDA